MGVFIDSADLNEVRRAVDLGFVTGCTTNPSLMAQVKAEPADVILDICRLVSGPVFYQVTAASIEEREGEGREISRLAPDKVVLKIPATTENMTLVTRLAPEIPCAVTAVYSPAQAWLAAQAGARYVIPYVNRATRLLGDGVKLVADLAAIVRASGMPVEILAASIKTPDEAAAVALAGAEHLTLPLGVMMALGNHPLTDAAIAEFNKAGR
ncbi:MAG: transaldolase family protein [bacterium]